MTAGRGYASNDSTEGGDDDTQRSAKVHQSVRAAAAQVRANAAHQPGSRGRVVRVCGAGGGQQQLADEEGGLA